MSWQFRRDFDGTLLKPLNSPEFALTPPEPAFTMCGLFGPLAQLAEHLPFKERVAGSSPARLTRNSQRPSHGLLFPPPPGPVRLVRPRTPPFHGDNRGSNPIRDATLITYRKIRDPRPTLERLFT